MPINLNLPLLSESDPGKPIKASWGDRVVEAIGINCDSIIALGKPNSVFSQFRGDGLGGSIDAAVSQSIAVPYTGLQLNDLTVRAGVQLTFTRTVTGVAPVDNFGCFRIGVRGTLTMEPGSSIVFSNQGLLGGIGGQTGSAGGAEGVGNLGVGVTQGGAGGGGGGGGGRLGAFGNGGPGGRPGSIVGSHKFIFGLAGTAGTGGGVPGGPGFTDAASPYTSGMRLGTDLDFIIPGVGGGGGGAGATPSGGVSLGGNGGRGGGAAVFEINTLAILSDPTGPSPCVIRSRGENGGNGGDAGGTDNGAGGGGGGAAGGVIFGCYLDIVPLTFQPAFDVAAGAGGAGGIPLAGAPGFNPPRFGGAGAPGRPGYAVWGPIA